MWFLRLAKSRHKLFRVQFLFGTKTKSTYGNVLPNTWILDLSVKQGSQQSFQVLTPRQKWVNLPPTFYEFFIDFLVDFYLLCNIKKIWKARFPFWQIITDFDFWHGHKSKILTFLYKMRFNSFLKRINLCFRSKFLIFDHVKSQNRW